MKRTKPTNSLPQPPPPNLAELQRLMASAVMRPLDRMDRTNPRWVDGTATSDFAATLIKPNDRLTSLERLEIYNRQYWFRVLDCLYDDYPGLRAVLGGTRFQRLAQAYLEHHPSESFTLRNLGQHLISFIRDHPRWTHPHQPLALDMARLEWAQIVAFDGESKRPIDLAQLAGRDPNDLHLRLQPYLTLLDLNYPVDETIVKILRKDDKMRSESSNAVEPSARRSRNSSAWRIRPTPVFLAVHRVENEIYFKRLEPAQFQLLQAIQSGSSLADACATLTHTPPEDLGQWFTTWAALRWFWIQSSVSSN